MEMDQIDFIDEGAGRPRPKSGYRCKICGKEGGLADSHWYQLCPYKGKTSDKRTFNPPRKGYLCKFCHKQGGDPDSHWFQQCPRRTEFEGVQVPHPLKLRASSGPSGMMNLIPQAFSQTTAAMAALNLGVVPQAATGQLEYAQQFSANGMGIFMYPNQMLNSPQAQFHQQQQQLLFLQQQLAQQQQQQQQQQQRFRAQDFGGDEDGSKFLSEIAKKSQEMSFGGVAGANVQN